MKEPTMDEIHALVAFERDENGKLFTKAVLGNVRGNVWGNVLGNVCGDVCGGVYGSVGGNVYRNVDGHIYGNVLGDVSGNVLGLISGRKWQYVETPKEKVIRLIREGKGDEAIKVLEEE